LRLSNEPCDRRCLQLDGRRTSQILALVRQVEDEIGVINMAIGAAHAGLSSECAATSG